MKTIEEHNQEVLRRIERNYKTGVECPNCKKELMFTDDYIFTTLPPCRSVKCECGYKGTILV
jgi:hypothetical protein